jgi:hypothetical protein
VRAYRGSRYISPLILNFGTRWRWLVNFKRRPPNLGKERRCLLNTRLSGPRTELDSLEKRKILCSYQDSKFEPSTYTDYAILTIPWQTVVSYTPPALAYINSVFAHNLQRAAPWLLLWWPVFDPRPVHRDLWRTVALGQVFPRILRFRDLRSFGILRSVEW